MKKLFIVVLAAIGMVSCMNTDEVIEVSNGDAIAFADAFIENSVRATAYDNGSLDHFNVWGTVTAGQSTAPIFANTEVTKANGVWSYTGATQYWVKGVTYNFRALVDGTTPVVVDDMLTGVNVNITEQEDVLVAEDMNVTYTGGEKYVAFQFAHILSKVKFTFDTTIANTAYTYTISNVKIADKAEAAYDIASKVWSGHNGAATIEFTNLTDEMFLIPSAEEKTISFDVTLKLGDVELSKETKTVKTDVELEAGHAYNFTVVLGEPGEPIKFTATVLDWDLAGVNDFNYDISANNVVVKNGNGLQAVAAGIENGTIPTDVDIVLGGDIDLSAITSRSIVSNWEPIGTSEKPFTGTFDGKGYTISNLQLVSEESDFYVGFFGIAEDATIKNVVFNNVYVKVGGEESNDGGHIAAVVGALEGTSTIENVTVQGNVYIEADVTKNNASRVAAVVGGNGYGTVTVKNVHVKANEDSYVKANNCVGAIAGQLNWKASFENCTSNIDVTGTKFFAGGIIGVTATESTFVNCHSTGDIAITAGRSGKAHDHYRVGGIAGGWADNTTYPCVLTNCSYTGKISGENSDGSVVKKFDYMGYVGRGYTLNGCQGSKVVIDGINFVQAGNTAAEAGVYDVTNAEGETVVAVGSKEDLPKEGEKIDTNFAGNVTLGGDITVSANETNAGSGYGATGVKVTSGAVLDGQGNTLTVNDANGTWDCVVAATGGTIKNLTVAGAMRGIFMPGANGDVYIDNVIFKDVIYTFNSDAGNKNYGVYISNSTLNGWTSHSNVHKEVVYTNCKFGEGSGYAFCRPYGPTSFVGCDFEAGFQVDAIGKITFQNCTIGGVALTAENLSTLVTSGIENAAVLVSTEAELVKALAKGGVGNVYLANAIQIEGKEVTLDLNGKTIVAATSSAIEAKAGAKVTIKNGNITAYESVVRAIGGEVIIESGEFVSTGTAVGSPATYRYSVDCREGGKITINGGEFKSNNGLMNVGSEIVINGGKFENVVEKTMTRHFAYVSAPLTINGGEFLGKANSSAGGCFFCGAASGCDIQINGGKFTSLWVSGSVNRIFEVYYGGTINVTGGMFNTNGGIATFVEANTDDATKDAYPYVAK